MQVNVGSKINLFLFPSRRESPYKSISFLTLSDKDSKFSKIDFTLFIRSMRNEKSDGRAEGNAMHLQFPNTRTQRIHAVLKIMSKPMLIKVTET